MNYLSKTMTTTTQYINARLFLYMRNMMKIRFSSTEFFLNLFIYFLLYVNNRPLPNETRRGPHSRHHYRGLYTNHKYTYIVPKTNITRGR